MSTSEQGGGRDRKRTKSNKERAEELLQPQALACREPPLAFEKERALSKPHSDSRQGLCVAILGSNSKSKYMGSTPKATSFSKAASDKQLTHKQVTHAEHLRAYKAFLYFLPCLVGRKALSSSTIQMKSPQFRESKCLCKSWS